MFLWLPNKQMYLNMNNVLFVHFRSPDWIVGMMDGKETFSINSQSSPVDANVIVGYLNNNLFKLPQGAVSDPVQYAAK